MGSFTLGKNRVENHKTRKKDALSAANKPMQMGKSHSQWMLVPKTSRILPSAERAAKM